MNEWFDAFRCPPPHEDQWIFAVSRDFSGVELLRWNPEVNDWVDAAGDCDILHDGDFWVHYSVWTPAPKWMRMYCEQKTWEEKYKAWHSGLEMP